ncbi:MAG: hypoxanthine phosphoribosyltransferase [Myxococcales bacterium]|nr:MAG: hypoxanthine phosphoribosyltransferase [Myxococcales bacterium]
MKRPKALFDEATIAKRVQEMGKAIEQDYQGKNLVLIIVLKGSFVFAADLARTINLPLKTDFLGLRSYEGGTQSSGIVQITHDLNHPIEGKDVIVIEDIVDTGLTMDYLFENLATRKPNSVKLASLLHKPARTKTMINIDYLGFTIDDVFVVGYGMDFDERYRNLPYLGILENES